MTAPRAEREPEQEVEGDCPAHHFGEVGGGGTTSACSQKARRRRGLEPLAEDLRQEFPVTIPSLADWYCTSTAITLATTSTQTSR